MGRDTEDAAEPLGGNGLEFDLAEALPSRQESMSFKLSKT
jgi:hypothetical protein